MIRNRLLYKIISIYDILRYMIFYSDLLLMLHFVIHWLFMSLKLWTNYLINKHFVKDSDKLYNCLILYATYLSITRKCKVKITSSREIVNLFNLCIPHLWETLSEFLEIEFLSLVLKVKNAINWFSFSDLSIMFDLFFITRIR